MVRPAQCLGPLQGDQPTLPSLASWTLRVPAQPYALALVSYLRNSLAVHFLDHGRLFAADDPSTSPYAANALLPMSVGSLTRQMIVASWCTSQRNTRHGSGRTGRPHRPWQSHVRSKGRYKSSSLACEGGEGGEAPRAFLP